MVHRAPGRVARRSRGANRAYALAMTALALAVLYGLYFLIAYSSATP